MRERVETARVIRLAQSLGFTLREIAAISAEFQSDGVTVERVIAILQDRLRDLDRKAGQIAAMAAYLRKKVEWLKGGCVGPEPPLAWAMRGEGPDAIYACSIGLPETQESGQNA
jgi:MerR family transcriptional regulator, copper efflux regulator